MELEFESRADACREAIEREMQTAMDVVRSLVAFYVGSQKVERHEFKAFSKALLDQERSRAIRALEWIPRVPRSLRQSHVEEARADGLTRYEITELDPGGGLAPAAERDEYFPVCFVEPMEGNEEALGFDLGSEPTRREALARARETGEPLATAPVSLVQGGGSGKSILIVAPISVPPAMPSGAELSEPPGFALGTLDIQAAVHAALVYFRPLPLNLRLIDETAPQRKLLLHSTISPAAPAPGTVPDPKEMEDAEGKMHQARFVVAGRDWRIVCTPTGEYVESRKTWTPTVVLAAGLSLSGLLAGYLLLIAQWTSRLQKTVEARTRLLTEINTDLEHEVAEREQLTRALRSSEERFELAVKGSRDGIWDWNILTGEVFYSPRFKELLGYQDREMEDRYSDWESRLHPQDREVVLAALGSHLKERAPYDTEYRLLTKSGEYRWFRARGQAIWDGEGRPSRMAGSLTDITEPKAVEAHLLKTNRELDQTGRLKDAILASANYIIISTDLDGVITTFNPAASSLLGYPPEEIIWKLTPLSFHKKEEMIARAAVLSRELGEAVEPDFSVFVAKARLGMPDENEWTYTRKDGTEFPVRLSVTSLRARDGRITGFLGIARDITETRRVQRELQMLSMVASRTDNAVIISDPQGRLQWVNDGFTRLTGYALAEVRERKPGSFLQGPRSEPQVVEHMRRCLGRGDGFNVEIVNYRKSGSPYWVAIDARPIRDAEGRIIHYMAIERDISERKAAEQTLARQAEELARSNKDLEEFAYVASHDLRAPLRAIANLSEWLEEDLDGLLTGETKRQMDLLRARVRRMERLVDDLLTYSRAGSAHSEAEVVQVSQLLGNVIFLLTPPETFTIAVQEPMPVLKTFKAPLQQIFSNLIGNSIKHHDRPDGIVEVRSRDLGGFHEFTVADDGPGIAPEFQGRVFQMFQTLQARDRVEGSGMGLALVKKLVERQGGKVAMESTQGEGASFSFTWPKDVEAEGP